VQVSRFPSTLVAQLPRQNVKQPLFKSRVDLLYLVADGKSKVRIENVTRQAMGGATLIFP
jgi:hypothetical protein